MFDRIKSDADQLSAAKKIIDNPITLISGRGGTGKTEVVTSILYAMEEIYNKDYFIDDPDEERRKKEFEEVAKIRESNRDFLNKHKDVNYLLDFDS